MISSTDLLAAIRHRLLLVIAVAGLIFVVIMGMALLQPRQYTANSSLLVDLVQRDLANSNNNNQINNAQVVDSIIGTQIDILRSNAVLSEVARREPSFQSSEYGDSAESRMQSAIAKLRSQLVIGTDKGSNVIRLSYTAKSAELAASILNTVADVYLVKQVNLRVANARGNARWYDSRTNEVRKRLEQAQGRLSDFQRSNGIVGVDRMDLEADRARNLTNELVKAQAESADAGSRSGSLSDPAVAQSEIVQNLERDAGVQAGKVAQLARTLGPNHPDMRAASDELAALRSSLSQARQTQARSLSSNSASASRRESELRSQLAAQQSRLIGMSGVQDQLNVLQRDVEAARQTYDTIRQRSNEAALQSEASQANASRLDRAVSPALPSKPNLVIWFIAAIIMSAGGGLLAACVRELSNPRVRTRTGTARALDLDVIADMTEHRGQSAKEAIA